MAATLDLMYDDCPSGIIICSFTPSHINCTSVITDSPSLPGSGNYATFQMSDPSQAWQLDQIISVNEQQRR